jgi:hypothetical protein
MFLEIQTLGTLYYLTCVIIYSLYVCVCVGPWIVVRVARTVMCDMAYNFLTNMNCVGPVYVDSCLPTVPQFRVFNVSEEHTIPFFKI